MRIVVDRDIPCVTEALADIGDVALVEGRSMCPETLADTDILLVRSVTPVSERLIKGVKKLKFIASATSGREHIDLQYLEKRGITFAYAPGSNANSVAQYVVAALLQTARERNISLADMTLGIIGAGNIGNLVRKYAGALGMRCLLNDPPKQRESGKEIYLPLDEVLAESDAVTLHVPLEKQGRDPTFHLVDNAFINRMKPGCILINTSRGKVVDEDALKKRRAKFGGCIIDVWDNEPAFDADLCGIADIATPHIAGYSFDGKIKGTFMVHCALCSFLKREPFWNPAMVVLSEPAGVIDASGTEEPVAYTVHYAYPIMQDDEALRKTALLNAGERKTGFDALRAGYPKRSEFGHFQVSCSKSQVKAAEILNKLGFFTYIEQV